MVSHLWEEYVKRVMIEYNVDKIQTQRNKIDNIQELIDKTKEGKILDDLGIENYCCRRMFLSNIDLIETI
jgi:DNA-directed RNA polymerase subunit N (RpoN/RPB10)